MSAGVEIPGEFDVLAGALRDPDYRRRAVSALAGAPVRWSSAGADAAWALIVALEPGDRPDAVAVERWVRRHVGDEPTRLAALRIATRAMSSSPRAAGLALADARAMVTEQRVRLAMEQAIDRLRASDPEGARQALATAEAAESGDEAEIVDWLGTFPARQRARITPAPTAAQPIPTGIPTFDGALNGGPRPGDFVALIGATNNGKSVLAGVEVAYRAAMAGARTLLIATEMDAQAVATRLDSRHFGIDHDRLVGGVLPGGVQAAMLRTASASAELREMLTIVSVPPLTLTTAKLERMITDAQVDGRPYRLVVVDSPDHMRCDDQRIKEPHRQHAYIWWRLKAIWATRRVAGWATTQATRGARALVVEGVPIARAEDVADSIDKVRIASAVLSINSTAALREQGLAILYLSKNRSGPAPRWCWAATEFAQMRISETAPP